MLCISTVLVEFVLIFISTSASGKLFLTILLPVYCTEISPLEIPEIKVLFVIRFSVDVLSMLIAVPMAYSELRKFNDQ